MESLNPVEPSKVAIEVVRTETVKPSSPTPDHLRKFGMTVFDQVSSNIYIPIVFFYPADEKMCVADRNRRLKESLSETLVRFYPVSGKIDLEEVYVDCDDSGVDFIETKVNGCRLENILRRPDYEVLCKLLPCPTHMGGLDCLMRVQSNVFECGGMALGVCFSHLIMDACGTRALVETWTAVARGETERLTPLELDAVASRFLRVPNVGFTAYKNFFARAPECRTRRFVFDDAKVSSLREIATSARGVRPTRVEVVSALIWKCMVNAFTSKLGHETKPSLLIQATDLRRRVDPPLSKSSLGNMVWFGLAKSGDQNEFVNDLPSAIAQIKKGMSDMTRDFATKLRDSMEVLEASREMARLLTGDISLFFFSSLCGFEFYESDFGWGEPAWISIADLYSKNTVKMMDAKGGRIEAWITLLEEDMAFFETNTDLLEFASLNNPISLS